MPLLGGSGVYSRVTNNRGTGVCFNRGNNVAVLDTAIEGKASNDPRNCSR